MKAKNMVVTIGTLSLASVVLAAPSVVYVSTDSADILQGKGAIYPVVQQVNRGTPLTYDRVDDDWYVVSVPASGYVFKDSIVPDKPSADPLGPIAGSSELSTTAATKGMQPETVTYAKSKNESPDMLLQLVDFRNNNLTIDEIRAFAEEGKVGIANPAK